MRRAPPAGPTSNSPSSYYSFALGKSATSADQFKYASLYIYDKDFKV